MTAAETVFNVVYMLIILFMSAVASKSAEYGNYSAACNWTLAAVVVTAIAVVVHNLVIQV